MITGPRHFLLLRQLPPLYQIPQRCLYESIYILCPLPHFLFTQPTPAWFLPNFSWNSFSWLRPPQHSKSKEHPSVLISSDLYVGSEALTLLLWEPPLLAVGTRLAPAWPDHGFSVSQLALLPPHHAAHWGISGLGLYFLPLPNSEIWPVFWNNQINISTPKLSFKLLPHVFGHFRLYSNTLLWPSFLPNLFSDHFPSEKNFGHNGFLSISIKHKDCPLNAQGSMLYLVLCGSDSSSCRQNYLITPISISLLPILTAQSQESYFFHL